MRTRMIDNATQARRKWGFTLVELMIGMALGGLVLLGVVSVFISSKQSYRYNEAMARIQENGRFAIGLLERDTRMSVYGGCKNLVLQLTGLHGDARTMLGTIYDDYVDWLVARPYTNGTDTGFSVLNGGPGLVLEVDYKGGTSLQMGNADQYFVKDQIGLITDCDRVGVFQVADVSDTGITLTSQVQGVSSFIDFDARTSTVLTAPVWTTYYVGDVVRTEGGQNRTVRSLFRQVAGQTPVELVEGVEDIYVQYGLREKTAAYEGTIAPYDPIGNYVDTVTDANLSEVGALRIQLLMRSPEDNVFNEGKARSIAFGPAGTYAIGADDKKLYEVFTTTVALRNRVR